uniref:CAP-Gly domain-containing protein n=1 Tax=Glossina pallidipes TaxID=7398 RepID=A0A1A9ZN83_GLOPL
MEVSPEMTFNYESVTSCSKGKSSISFRNKWSFETVRRFTRSSLSPEVDRYSPMRYSFRASANKQNFDINRRQSYDLYLEATGRRRSSDHGAILTHDTEQFIIGQRVWVGGIRPGQIAYIGETHFAPGEWAGVVLDEPNGKNDGCVAGKRYFQCEPKRGIFSRLTRLTLSPLPGAQTLASPLQKNSPERSRTVSPTASTRSSFLRIPGKNGLTVGDRIIVSSGFGSRPGILRYLGETQFASGNWCGIELDEATGKNDGSVDGVRYFECKPKYGVFVPIAKVSLSPSSKKTRLSRTGSRESLTSVGTFNSIASTNTSRLRLNSQDLLREKQSHIEQIMIERELDREDSQNQALQYQKNINEKILIDAERWSKLIKRRNFPLSELRREFRGWTGNHEKHCILHSVLTPLRIK